MHKFTIHLVQEDIAYLKKLSCQDMKKTFPDLIEEIDPKTLTHKEGAKVIDERDINNLSQEDLNSFLAYQVLSLLEWNSTLDFLDEVRLPKDADDKIDLEFDAKGIEAISKAAKAIALSEGHLVTKLLLSSLQDFRNDEISFATCKELLLDQIELDTEYYTKRGDKEGLEYTNWLLWETKSGDNYDDIEATEISDLYKRKAEIVEIVGVDNAERLMDAAKSFAKYLLTRDIDDEYFNGVLEEFCRQHFEDIFSLQDLGLCFELGFLALKDEPDADTKTSGVPIILNRDDKRYVGMPSDLMRRYALVESEEDAWFVSLLDADDKGLELARKKWEED